MSKWKSILFHPFICCIDNMSYVSLDTRFIIVTVYLWRVETKSQVHLSGSGRRVLDCIFRRGVWGSLLSVCSREKGQDFPRTRALWLRLEMYHLTWAHTWGVTALCLCLSYSSLHTHMHMGVSRGRAVPIEAGDKVSDVTFSPQLLFLTGRLRILIFN